MACRKSVGRVSGKAGFQTGTRTLCRLYTIFRRISEIVENFKLRHDRTSVLSKSAMSHVIAIALSSVKVLAILVTKKTVIKPLNVEAVQEPYRA